MNLPKSGLLSLLTRTACPLNFIASDFYLSPYLEPIGLQSRCKRKRRQPVNNSLVIDHWLLITANRSLKNTILDKYYIALFQSLLVNFAG
jgi:hypothetical protein